MYIIDDVRLYHSCYFRVWIPLWEYLLVRFSLHRYVQFTMLHLQS